MSHEKSRILAHLRFPLSFQRRPIHSWIFVGTAAFALGAGVTAFGTAPSTITQNVRQQEIVERIASVATPISPAEDVFVREERIRRGDTAASLLKRLGVDEAATLDLLRQTPNTDALFRQISPGKIVTAKVDSDGTLQSLSFPLNGTTAQVLHIGRTAQGFKASEKALTEDTQVVMKSAQISYSLFSATDAAGIPDAVASQMADIFGSDIDFHRDLRKGDRFSVIYESITSEGKPGRTGRILAAEFVNDGKTYRAVWFGDREGKGGYYSPEGKSLRKAFLRSPLEFSRVTSGFSTARFHPVLQTWRAHKGVDYGAPVGTKVRSTADGVVEFVGTQGGYGKVVVIRHQGRYSTVYGHLSRFGPGIRVGARVSQGDTIAFTGQSGLATGPHLHYEFRVDGIHQNPLTVALPGTPPLGPQQLASFHKQADMQMERLGMLRNSNLAALD